MKVFVFILIIISLITPFFVFADCNPSGTTVLFVNGMFTFSRQQADDARRDLKYQYTIKGKNSDVNFILGYNPSHIVVLGDMINAVSQAYADGFLDYDLTNILRQAHTDLKTQKILLVGHSQGTFYTNEAYDYLISHGVDKNSIAVYNVGTPANRVAGNGSYLTSSTDKVINAVRGLTTLGFAHKPLASNIDLKLSQSEAINPLGGHDFSSVYLAEAPDKIISDMDEEINKLKAGGSNKSECFVQPEIDTSYMVKDAGYGTIDTFVTYFGDTTTSPFRSPEQLTGFAQLLLARIYSFGQSVFSGTKKVFASIDSELFLTSTAPEDSVQELSGTGDTATVDIPPSQTQQTETITGADTTDYNSTGGHDTTISTEEDRQDLLDDIQEKLDIISSQVQILVAQQNQNNQPPAIDTAQKPDDKTSKDQDSNKNDNNPDNNINIQNTGSSGGVGGGAIIYPKVLISEVQPDDTQEFIELYNPNSQDIDLTNWYLQRKTAGSQTWSTFVSKNLFSGKIISKNGYFLIARTGYFIGAANIFIDTAITKDNSFVLKNPNEDISDKLGFGNAQDPETSAIMNPAVAGQTIGRKVLSDGTEQDTDNNSNDFELQNPTPYAQNKTYVFVETQPGQQPPIQPEPPAIPLKNILINEIQIDSIAGTGGTDDDWVELYNPNDTDVSLAGWSIQKSGYSKDNCSINTSFYSKQFDSDAKIPANGFYLVVSTKANDSLKALASPPNGMTIGWTLSDNGVVYLVKNAEKITDSKDLDISDEVGYGTACFFEGTNPAVNPPDGKSIERKKLGVDTDDNLADFKISDEPTPGQASPKAYIQDATDYSKAMLTSIPGTSYYNLDIKWRTSSSNLDYFQVQYKLNDGSWQDWDAKTTDTEKTFQAYYSLYQDKIYTFRAKAYDKDGNTGNWSEVTIDLTNPVVINEIAFYGIGDANLKHKQWMELYNRSNNPIVLDGWKIISNNNLYMNVTLQGTIPANGYFILEKKDDSSISDVSADQIFNGVIPVANTIYLRNGNNRLTDQVYIDWPEGQFIKDGNYYSAERISPFSFGQDPQNWRIGIDPAFGTPNKQNSIYQLYTSNFTNSFVEDTTLKQSLSPYLFQGPTYVLPGVTLTIEPGTVIKFFGSRPSLTVDGSVKAVGDDANKIVFTSYDDNDYGGDIRTPGDTTQANPGQWLGILFNQDSSGSDLENTIVRYAGANSSGDYKAGIKVDRSSILLKDSVIEKNLNNGVWLVNSPSIIDSVQFLDNQTTDSSLLNGEAIFVQGGNPEIKNCIFKRNYYSIFLTDIGQDASPSVENNDFQENNYSIYLTGSNIYPNFTGDTATNNNSNAIVLSDQIAKDMTLNSDLPYLIRGVFNIPQNTTLTVNPGTILKFADSSLNVDGTLTAIGTSSQPIVFTSADDSDYGQDIRAPGDTSQANPGQWPGIIFNRDSTNSDLENIVLRYAGGSLPVYFGAGIKVDQSTISLKNSTIKNNVNNGVWLVNSPSIIESTQFLGNKSVNGSPVANGVFINGGGPEIKQSNFDDNDYGIYMNDLGDISCTPNLHATDPADPDQNTFGINIKKDIYNASAP
jgi:hypothetical protein